jgi:hypothetical protein
VFALDVNTSEEEFERKKKYGFQEKVDIISQK